MKLKCLGSSSAGNCYLLTSNSGETLILDCGIPIKEIKKGLNWNIRNVVGCIVSHVHSDHTRSLDYLLSIGVSCYGNVAVCEKHKGCQLIPRALHIGGYKVQSFALVHNVENNAFVIDTHNGIRILYCTDTQYIPKIVRGVHYAIIECNYDMDYMIDNAMVGEIRKSAYNYHQSIDNCIEYAKKIYHPNMQKIILWHLSDGNINEKNALTKTRYELSTNDIIIGDNGVEIALKKNEFEI